MASSRLCTIGQDNAKKALLTTEVRSKWPMVRASMKGTDLARETGPKTWISQIFADFTPGPGIQGS